MKGNKMAGRLQGKNAMVTGGARGIGDLIATAFARKGVGVGVLDLELERAGKGGGADAFRVKTFAVAPCQR
jgi:NAD(P)-dependent dehydrogenase (short-subunit alcohol dehydrogenase family)